MKGSIMPVSANWGMLGLSSGIVFMAGWFLFGMMGAVLLAVMAMIAVDIARFRQVSG